MSNCQQERNRIIWWLELGNSEIISGRWCARDFRVEHDDDVRGCVLHHSRLRNHRARRNRRNRRAHHNHRNLRARRNCGVPPARRQVRNRQKLPTTSSETIKQEPISIDECGKLEIY